MAAKVVEKHILTKVVEKHILTGKPEVHVYVWDNGNVDILIGEENVDAARLSEIVAFAEMHGQITVNADA